MNITQDNRPVNVISPGTISHTFDDDESNVLNRPALLHVEEQMTIKVMCWNGNIETLTDYDNWPAIQVKKVYSTGTDDTTKVKLWE